MKSGVRDFGPLITRQPGLADEGANAASLDGENHVATHFKGKP
jgi:hypothetical protein